MHEAALEIVSVDPRSTEARELIRALSRDLARRYDYRDDGSGNFAPEDVLNARAAFLIARLGDRAIGCGAFRPLTKDVAEVKRMYVIPECRGRGYGKLVLKELEQLAGKSGYTAVRLETADRQPEAISLYEGAGYYRIPNFGIYVGSKRSICFEKQL